MQDASVDGQKESQSNLGEIPVIRPPDMCVGESQKSSYAVSSGSSEVEKVGDDKEINRGEEYYYIRSSNVAVHPQRLEYGDLSKLGPKTKDTELRLGLPVDAERNGARSVDKDTNMEGFHGSVVGKGGNSSQNLHGPFSTGEMGPEQSRFLGVPEPHGRGHLSQRQEEQKQKMGFQEFPGRELPFDVRFSQQELWAKPMMAMPPLNSYFRTEDKRTVSSGGKRIFSDTLPGSPNFMPQLDLPKLPFSHSQLRLPHSSFTFPFAGGANLMWDSQQGKSNLGNFGGHLGANLLPASTPEMRIECVGEASSSQAPQQADTLATSVNMSNKAQTGGSGNGVAEQSGPRAAPVVGWPPIRTFRKNLASQPKGAPIPPPVPVPAPAPAPAPVPARSHVPGSVPAPAPVLASAVAPLTGDSSGKKNSKTMFVKVNMEGVPIGRKIDIKAYDTYEKLYVALDEMFRGSIPAQRPEPNPSSENTEPSVLSVRDFLVVYEDDEGDRMLVGDVPWGMFVNTVKRLRVIKSSKARGLAVDRQEIKTAQ